jgi:hypothetical protein
MRIVHHALDKFVSDPSQHLATQIALIFTPAAISGANFAAADFAPHRLTPRPPCSFLSSLQLILFRLHTYRPSMIQRCQWD